MLVIQLNCTGNLYKYKTIHMEIFLEAAFTRVFCHINKLNKLSIIRSIIYRALVFACRRFMKTIKI